jgi:DNA-binding transcriptional ArsR family regulator
MSNDLETDIAAMALKFKALSAPTRLKIFMALSQCHALKSQSKMWHGMGDLASLVDIAPSTFSHHIKVLGEAGLIETQRDGKRVFCRVNADILPQLSDYFKSMKEVCDE